jgi:hypothetical protein
MSFVEVRTAVARWSKRHSEIVRHAGCRVGAQGLAMGIFADGDRNDEPKCCVGKCRLSSDPYSARV